MTTELNVTWHGQADNERPDLGFYIVPKVQTQVLYEARPQTGTYSHHGHILHFRDSFFATWSNHSADEDAPGQRVLLSRSVDGGRTWTAPSEVLPPLDHTEPAGRDGWDRRTMCANGFALADGALYAIGECWQHGGGYRGEDMGLGRLCRSIAPDGQLGPVFWLHDQSPRPLKGFAAYPGAADLRFGATAAKIRSYLARPEHCPTWEFRYQTTRPQAGDGHLLCEPTYAWRLRDGTFVRLWRDLGGSRFNYASFSRDDGRSWTLGVRTNFPDASARSNAGTLPDGTVYVISNIRRGNMSGIPARVPLAISLSSNGLAFDRVGILAHGLPSQRYAGRWKGQGFQYPHSIVVAGHLWVIYSVNKEDVWVSSVSLEELKRIPPVSAVTQQVAYC